MMMRTEQEINKKITEFQTWGRIFYYTNTGELGQELRNLLEWTMGKDNTFSKNLAAWDSLPEDVKKMRMQCYKEDEIIRRERN